MTPTLPAEAVANPDGTYTIDCGPVFDEPEVHSVWTLHSTCEGWLASHPHDGWGQVRFATAADAAQAVLGDPTNCRLFDGRAYGEVYGQ